MMLIGVGEFLFGVYYFNLVVVVIVLIIVYDGMLVLWYWYVSYFKVSFLFYFKEFFWVIIKSWKNVRFVFGLDKFEWNLCYCMSILFCGVVDIRFKFIFFEK